MGKNKSRRVHPPYKTKYRVGNWREYEAWERRRPIHTHERNSFREQVLERWASIVTAEQNEQGGTLTKPELARTERTAIQWVLIAEGYLVARRRRISPSIKRRKAS